MFCFCFSFVYSPRLFEYKHAKIESHHLPLALRRNTFKFSGLLTIRQRNTHLLRCKVTTFS